MFLSYIKNYFLLKLLKNNLHNLIGTTQTSPIKTVGLLIDESYFFDTESLINEINANGISESNIKVIVYKDKIKKNEENKNPVFSLKHLNWNIQITNNIINDFINEKFDILISYYDIEKAFLHKVTRNSKALFKVGFSSVDKRLNHLMINTNAENHSVFVHELFRYLKILNKI